jgi:hypothetical protein
MSAPSEPPAEVVFNRANVALARSQRLIAAWLPQPEKTDDGAAAKSEQEALGAEDEEFAPAPDRYAFRLKSGL